MGREEDIPPQAQGLVFDIEEFAVHDGPGLRTAVFFKGCPLRCRWCHNPEGLSPRLEIFHSLSGCTRCGRCSEVCPSPEGCVLCERCVAVCPFGLRRVAGQWWDPKKLAHKLKKHADIFEETGGGVTLTGGEVLMQPQFLLSLLDELDGVHRAIETSGFGAADVFPLVLARCELVIFDLKQMNDRIHREITGVSNRPILQNLRILQKSGLPYVVRIPLIPGVNDTTAHFEMVAKTLTASPGGLLYVEILPYNRFAGAKYPAVGRIYDPGFQDSAVPAPGAAEILRKNQIEVRDYE